MLVGPYVIEPLPDHAVIVKEVLKQQRSDGFIYPSATEPPTSFFSSPPTHTVRLQGDEYLSANFRGRDGAFLIRLLAVMNGARAQFYDWRYDIRFPLRQNSIAVFTNAEFAMFMAEIYAAFSVWDYDKQRRYCNILYLHARCPA